MASLDGVRLGAPTEAGRVAEVVTLPFRIVSQRVVLDIDIVTTDGRSRRVAAWLNMGMSSPIVLPSLHRELGLDRGAPLELRHGAFAFPIPGTIVTAGGMGEWGGPDFAHLFAPEPVQMMLPLGLFQQFVVTLDFGAGTLTLARPGLAKPDGAVVPIAVNRQTGLIAVKASVDGQTLPLVIDAGSGYTWLRGEVVRAWVNRHPDWLRSNGAIGASNANMLDYAFEKKGEVARLPALTLGRVQLDNVGVMGTAPILGKTLDGLFGNYFWDNWQDASPFPVDGWIGMNVLRHYRITIDFSGLMSYWKALSPLDVTELDQVPITLVRDGDRYRIGGVVRLPRMGLQDHAIEPEIASGDELVAIDGASVLGASRDSVLQRLRGTAGDIKTLTLIHDGVMRNARAKVVGVH